MIKGPNLDTQFKIKVHHKRGIKFKDKAQGYYHQWFYPTWVRFKPPTPPSSSYWGQGVGMGGGEFLKL